MKISEIIRILLISGILTGFVANSLAEGKTPLKKCLSEDYRIEATAIIHNKTTIEVEKMNRRLLVALNSYLQKPLNKNSLKENQSLVDSIINRNEQVQIDSMVKADSYYFSGIFFSLTGNTEDAVKFLRLSHEIREKKGVFDLRTANVLYNIALAYRSLGDYYKEEEYSTLSINVFKQLFGESSRELLEPYTALAGAYIELQETAKAIDILNEALIIANNNIDNISARNLADIHSNLGVCYSRLADFTRAKIFYEKSENIHETNNLIFDENYINLINSLAITYGSLGLTDKSFDYYQKGVALAMTFPDGTSFTNNIINSFAINLADSSKFEKAVELYDFLIKKTGKNKKEYPQIYYEVLNNYAEYLREYKIDYAKSLYYNEQCMDYLIEHPEDHNLRTRIYVGYSLSLSKAGDPSKALEYIQSLITENYKFEDSQMVYSNPVIGDIKPDKQSLKIFKAKYDILWGIYNKTKDNEALKAAANTSGLVISLLERMRINISEEESRLLLGDKYRELYFKSVSSFNLLYKTTSDKEYLNKAFEYAEKSKVAGLLSSTRELKASQFKIPTDLADLEFRLKSRLGALNEMISENAGNENPNRVLLAELNEKVLRITRARDSLISVFEQDYPGYYSIKYNTQVASLESIPGIVGRNGNYINYLMSDSVLYIFIVNRKYSHLAALPITPGFYEQIEQFRSLLSMPGPSDDAASAFLTYQTTGYELYKKLIEPIRNFLISEKIVISPDNILSYIPFETLPTNEKTATGLQYRSLIYLMEDFDISYTYSATFMAESVNSGINFSNKTVSFAPNYPDPIDVRAVLMNRQEEQGILSDLPFARQEAEYVSETTNGSLYKNTEARESVFKSEAGKFDIIHLAMHTLMNDKDPMRSTLIFSPESDTLNDGYLKTFEIYGLPLRAEMVVLSSCNTGSGFLSTGEGILSLARGFIYSGSKSVVMSMWEIEDRSGTEIVKMFYKNLKRGYSKSESLRRARISYLKNSDQLRSHPYFWSALVVYGENDPLYFSRFLIIVIAAIILILSVSITIYFRKRRYS